MMVCTKEFHMTKIHTNSELAAAREPIAMGAPKWWYPNTMYSKIKEGARGDIVNQRYALQMQRCAVPCARSATEWPF